MPASIGTRGHVEDGEPRTEPCPPAELELSGFYLVECGEDEAIELGSRMPVVTHGTVEIRPVTDFSEPTSSW